MHLKYRRHSGKSTFIIIVFILVIVTVFILFYKLNKKITPTLMSFAEMEANKLSTLIINLAVTKQFKDEKAIDQLFVIQKNENDEIQTIDFKTNLVNQYLTSLTKYIQSYYRYIEKGEVEKIDQTLLDDYDINSLKKGIIYQMPLGVGLDNSLFSNLGPKIPVRLTLIGDIMGNINTKLTDYGINNALMEVTVHIEVTNQVILPLLSKKLITKIDVPIAIKIIQGKIPSSYINTVSKNSGTVMIPME